MEKELMHSIRVDDDVWLELIRRKYASRYRNINEPLRDALGLPLQDRIPVKIYSDEGDERGTARVRCRKESGLTCGDDRGVKSTTAT